VYCFDDADFVTTRYGFKKRVIIEPNFLLESLQDLDANLRRLGLMILRGKPEEEIPKL
jgi:deoxyribodipyrimidine photo-lyase